MQVLTNCQQSDVSRHGPATPSPWVRRFAPLIRPNGRVLDFAAGNGRHTIFLRQLGYAVVAVDRDIAALTLLPADPAISIVAIDLEEGAPWALGRGYDGIVVTNYLHRPLFAALRDALAPGGMLIYETFALGNDRFGKPSNPAFLLRQGELLEAFGQSLTVIAFEQGVVAQPKPAAVQRIAAVNGDPTPLPPLPGAGAE
jgi:SAM-dependent methyltransferase